MIMTLITDLFIINQVINIKIIKEILSKLILKHLIILTIHQKNNDHQYC